MWLVLSAIGLIIGVALIAFAVVRDNWDGVSRTNEFGVVQFESFGDWIGYHLKIGLSLILRLTGVSLGLLSAVIGALVLLSSSPSSNSDGEADGGEATAGKGGTLAGTAPSSQGEASEVQSTENATEETVSVTTEAATGRPAQCDIALGFGTGDSYTGPCLFSPTEARDGSFIVEQADGRPILENALAIRLDVTSPGKGRVTVSNASGAGNWQAGGTWVRDGACWMNQPEGEEVEDQDFSICVR